MRLTTKSVLYGTFALGALFFLSAYRPISSGIAGRLALQGSNGKLTGTIVGFGEADENEWFLKTATGTVKVDAGERYQQAIDLSMDETVAVTGELDGGEFDAFLIEREDGEVIEVLYQK